MQTSWGLLWRISWKVSWRWVTSCNMLCRGRCTSQDLVLFSSKFGAATRQGWLDAQAKMQVFATSAMHRWIVAQLKLRGQHCRRCI